MTRGVFDALLCSMPAAQSSASKTPRVMLLQDGFTQNVGIALAGLGELDHSPGNDLVGEIAVATCKSQGHAGHFKCDPEDALGLGISLEAVEVRRDGHWCAPIRSGGSATGLSAAGA